MNAGGGRVEGGSEHKICEYNWGGRVEGGEEGGGQRTSNYPITGLKGVVVKLSPLNSPTPLFSASKSSNFI